MGDALPTEPDDLFWRSAYCDHAPAVLGYLLRRLGRRDEAEDLLQETFLRAMRAASFRVGGNLRGYLLAGAKNLLISRLRRPRLVVALEPRPDELDPFDSLPTNDASPDEVLAWKGFRADLHKAVTVLSQDLQRAFQLGIVEKRPYVEIAQITGWSAAQVKINVFRARHRVGGALAQHLTKSEVDDER
jgi:RNA polymerase sigma-70 factor, ECF subfamily